MRKNVVLSHGGLSLGTVSMRRKWRVLGAYVLCVALLAMFAVVLQSDEVNTVVDGGNATDRNSALTRAMLANIFQQRRQILDQTCARYAADARRAESSALVNATVQRERFFHMKEPDFMMCMIPKVASSSFSKFIIRAHQKFPHGMSNIGHEKTFEDGATNVTYKVLAVRHPLERLLSAYMYILNDEMIRDPNRTNLFSNLTKLLLRNYRKDPDELRDIITFPEFVRFIINGTAEGLQGYWHTTNGKDDQHWIRDPNLNAHWLPYWRMCSPCHPLARPKVILKLSNTLMDEFNYAFEEGGVFDYFRSKGLTDKDLQLPWANPSREGRAERLRKKYFGQLDKRTVEVLYHKYKLDHELFDYDIEPYRSLAKD